VFDNSWASAYARNGARYYPKLQCCVPFTPVTGPRLLVRSDALAGMTTTLAQGLAAVADAMDVSSCHVTFPSRAEAELLVQDGWLMRTGIQYHWVNRGYTSFADFEAALTQKRRKTVRQERKKAQEGLVMRRLRGDDIKQHHWDAFYEFYCDTAEKKWGTACASSPSALSALRCLTSSLAQT
jgi:predicted N-acyltransferase